MVGGMRWQRKKIRPNIGTKYEGVAKLQYIPPGAPQDARRMNSGSQKSNMVWVSRCGQQIMLTHHQLARTFVSVSSKGDVMCTSKAFLVADESTEMGRNIFAAVQPSNVQLGGNYTYSYCMIWFISHEKFDSKNLIPPAPALPSCDIPGTQGRMNPYTAQGNSVYQTGTMTILGSGNTVHSTGISENIPLTHYTEPLRFGERHIPCWHALPRKRSLRQVCKLSRSVGGWPNTPNCNGGLNNAVNAPFNWVINNQQLECVILFAGNTAGNYYNICGGTVAAAKLVPIR
ncbi:hypothetical protein DFH09DRAFT_1071716 [Mycena vulgaris]|nr:hypothetical protein DFH09DRAFT_1071716 [Mycena vulgaris]